MAALEVALEALAHPTGQGKDGRLAHRVRRAPAIRAPPAKGNIMLNQSLAIGTRQKANAEVQAVEAHLVEVLMGASPSLAAASSTFFSIPRNLRK